MSLDASQLLIVDDLLRHLRVILGATPAARCPGTALKKGVYGLASLLSPEEFRRLVDFRIGLTDVCETSGPD